jgi:tRNA(Ile)-lysidine synthase
VLRYIEAQRLLPAGECVVVGVSGGADSTALLLLLTRLAPRLGITERAAYFDHQLRGKKASNEERETVARLTNALGVPLTVGSGDVRAYARQKRLGIEEAARELRYRFLADAARDVGARTVAVGHTADDQIETVLLHILRGSGLTGLAGMLPRSPWPVAAAGRPEVTLVRPLLEVRRAETESYCREMGREPLEDATNRSPRYKRNVVRNELLPLLRAHVPSIDASLLRLAQTAATERRALEETAERALAQSATFEGESVRLSLASLREIPAGLLPHVMRLAASKLLGDARDLGERHLQAMAAAAAKPAGTELDLPRGLHLRVEYGEIVLALGESTAGALAAGGVPLVVPGATTADGWRIEASLSGDASSLPESAWEAALDADALAGRLRVRRRRPGDRYRPLGLVGEKKLQDVLVDLKVPRRRRDNIPVVEDEAGIVWVAGYRIAERAKLTPSTRRVLRLSVREA